MGASVNRNLINDWWFLSQRPAKTDASAVISAILRCLVQAKATGRDVASIGATGAVAPGPKGIRGPLNPDYCCILQFNE